MEKNYVRRPRTLIDEDDLCHHDKHKLHCKACKILTFKLSKNPGIYLPNEVWLFIMEKLPNHYSFILRQKSLNFYNDSRDFHNYFFTFTDREFEWKTPYINIYRILFVGSELSFLAFIFKLIIFGGRNLNITTPLFTHLLESIPIEEFRIKRDLSKFFFTDKKLFRNPEFSSALVIRVIKNFPSAKFAIKYEEIKEFKAGWQVYQNLEDIIGPDGHKVNILHDQPDLCCSHNSDPSESYQCRVNMYDKNYILEKSVKVFYMIMPLPDDNLEFEEYSYE